MSLGLTFLRGPLNGRVRVAGDKSISHRTLILAALADGTSRIWGGNAGADVRATRDALVALGSEIDGADDDLTVRGGPIHDPLGPIDARNSGTTARLLLGLCAGHGIAATFDGDLSLRGRPMERVARPLRALGAAVTTTEGTLPARVLGISQPPGGSYALDVPSAQVKSAILLASLDARKAVRITGDRGTRDHTERLLRHFGRTIAFNGSEILLEAGRLRSADVTIPGDLSAAAFFLVAAATTPGSDVTVEGVGVNPTRTGILDALASMGADIAILNARDIDGEPVADVRVRYGPLRAIDVGAREVVRTIDEIPVLAVAAAHATGTTHVREARELRSKESDRIATVVATLRACGVAAVEHDDGFAVSGGSLRAPGTTLPTFGDHRVAMSIAALAAACGPIGIDDAGCLDVSFPGFSQRWTTAQTSAYGSG